MPGMPDRRTNRRTLGIGGMTKPASARLYRLALTYRLDEGGLLAAETLPAERLAALREGALYRRLARLADADDSALVAAASRYGPLGPTRPISVPNQAAYLWAADSAVRGNVRNLGLLRKGLAHGSATPIPGRVALPCASHFRSRPRFR